MPACFQLTRKGEKEPIVLQRLDEEICAVLGEPVHPKEWCRGWFHMIGLNLALGRGFDDIRQRIVEEEVEFLLPILNYIEVNFDADAWHERGGLR